jgi:hypothetical protein
VGEMENQFDLRVSCYLVNIDLTGSHLKYQIVTFGEALVTNAKILALKKQG